MIVIVAVSFASEPNGPAVLVDLDQLPDCEYKQAILDALEDSSGIAELNHEGLEQYWQNEHAEVKFPFTGEIFESVILYVD